MTLQIPHFFTRHSRHLSAKTLTPSPYMPFKNHPQFAMIIDILSRKDHHHLLLRTDFSPKMRTAYLEAFLIYLEQNPVPASLQRLEILDYDTPEWSMMVDHDSATALDDAYQWLRDYLEQADHCLAFFMKRHLLYPDYQAKAEALLLAGRLQKLFHHPKCRFIILENTTDKPEHLPRLDNQCTTLTLSALTEPDRMALLKQQRLELEQFHRVTIPEERLNQAYALAERYLSTRDTFEKTILLLDSSAARASIAHAEHPNETRPELTASGLLDVLSNWTQIPSSQLLFNQFRLSTFIETMQQRIFGQDSAIQQVGQALQQAQANIRHRAGPFCTLLLAGPPHVGKKTLSIALADQLFKQIHLFYEADLSADRYQTETSAHPLLSIKVQRPTDKHYQRLEIAIQQTPYALFFFKNIELATEGTLNDLLEIIHTGFLQDADGLHYDFRQAILLLSTTLGSDAITAFAEQRIAAEEEREASLLQLVMRMQDNALPMQTNTLFTSLELIEQIKPALAAHLPAVFYQSTSIVPFMPLDKAAIENIIRIKLKSLGKMLNAHHGIELGYATEVVRYISKMVLNEHTGNIDIETALKQLYVVIEQSIMSQNDHPARPNQLFLQLNETGHALRCEWLDMTPRHHPA